MAEPSVWMRILKRNIFMLQALGVWPINTSTETYRTLSKSYSVVVVAFFILLCICLQAIQLSFIAEWEPFLVSATIVIHECEIACKIFCFLGHYNTLERSLAFMDRTPEMQPKSHQKFVLSDLNFWFKNFVVMNLAGFCTHLSWSVFPLFAADRKHFINSWFPFDATVSPFYEIVYVYHATHLWFACMAVHNINSFGFGLLTLIASQCDILCDNLKQLGWKNIEDIEEEFVRCVEHHQMIISFADDCVRLVSRLTFLQMTTTVVSVGVLLLHLTKVPSFSAEFYHVTFYLFSLTFANFLSCWFGNEVLVKSSKISNSAYEINFVDAPLPMKKSLIFFITRTQRPITVPILFSADLTLDTFIKFMKTAWSYFTLLQQVTVEK